VKGFDMKQAGTLGHEVLEMVRLSERLDAYPNELSGGMMQRIAVARALAAGAQLLLLDEPLGQLDAKVRNDLRYEIRRMTKDLRLTAIHVTHDQAEAMAISDRIAVMKKGKVKQVGTPSELYMTPDNVFVANFIGESNFLEGYVQKEQNNRMSIDIRGGIQIDVEKDKEALKQYLFTRKLKAQKLKAMIKKGQPAVPLDKITIGNDEYATYLKMAYKEEKFPKPRNILGFAKNLPVPEMEKLMLTHIDVNDDDLRHLASLRATEAKDFILKAGRVTADRMFIVEPKSLEPEQKEGLKNSRVNFKLQ
jgi:ABC-type Fe3+/spermidine/putrescine transport system ATPase subunit